MAKLPRIPHAWNDPPAVAPPQASRPVNSAQTAEKTSAPRDISAHPPNRPFQIAPNPRAKEDAPWYEIPTFSSVDEYSTLVDRAAHDNNVDARLIRAIMYVETTHGYYDKPFSWLGWNDTILPMNVSVKKWGNSMGGRTGLENAETNINAGAKILAGITKGLPSGSNVAQIATLYNNMRATKVSDYGARVAAVYEAQPWKH